MVVAEVKMLDKTREDDLPSSQDSGSFMDNSFEKDIVKPNLTPDESGIEHFCFALRESLYKRSWEKWDMFPVKHHRQVHV